eukprot:scaffold98315_cov64-Phaeocystis_antarctica.AAC.6
MHMRCTRGAHAVHMRCTCGAHAVHMRCTCGAHAVHMQSVRDLHSGVGGGRRQHSLEQRAYPGGPLQGPVLQRVEEAHAAQLADRRLLGLLECRGKDLVGRRPRARQPRRLAASPNPNPPQPQRLS